MFRMSMSMPRDVVVTVEARVNAHAAIALYGEEGTAQQRMVVAAHRYSERRRAGHVGTI